MPYYKTATNFSLALRLGVKIIYHNHPNQINQVAGNPFAWVQPTYSL
jgi:hypothetical protein